MQYPLETSDCAKPTLRERASFFVSFNVLNKFNKIMQLEQNVNILLVDDDAENLLILEAILKSLQRNLVKANSGREALQHTQEQDFAVILLDVQMPELDGFDTAKLIRQHPKTQRTPIIFLTENSTKTFMSQGYSVGAVDYLIKPIDPEIVRAKVAVFVDLFEKMMEVERQAAHLQSIVEDSSDRKHREEEIHILQAQLGMAIVKRDRTEQLEQERNFQMRQ